MSARFVRTACAGMTLHRGPILALLVMVVVPPSAQATEKVRQSVNGGPKCLQLAPMMRALVREGVGSFRAFVSARKRHRIRYGRTSAARLDDKGLDALAALERKAFRKAPWDKQRLAKYADLVTVFKSGDQIVGYVLLVDPQKDQYEPLYGPPLANTDESYLYVAHLAVDPRLKRNGVGSELVGKAFDQARQVGKKEVRLHVRAANGARNFYNRRGFRKGGTLSEVYPNLLTDVGVREDALEMWRSTSRLPSAHDVRQALHRLLALPRAQLEEQQGSSGAE